MWFKYSNGGWWRTLPSLRADRKNTLTVPAFNKGGERERRRGRGGVWGGEDGELVLPRQRMACGFSTLGCCVSRSRAPCWRSSRRSAEGWGTRSVTFSHQNTTLLFHRHDSSSSYLQPMHFNFDSDLVLTQYILQAPEVDTSSAKKHGRPSALSLFSCLFLAQLQARQLKGWSNHQIRKWRQCLAVPK